MKDHAEKINPPAHPLRQVSLALCNKRSDREGMVIIKQ